MQTALMAQQTTGDVVFNLTLQGTLNLTILPGGTPQAILFQNAANYNNGVTGGAGITPGNTQITIEATQNWHLMIGCLTNFTGTAGTIPINNLGVYCEATGTHKFTNIPAEVTSTCQISANAMGLKIGDLELIGLGSGNMGDATDNAFTLKWEMGTMKVANPNPMHNTSMFDQMANGDFVVGLASTTATLTLIGL
jgi:hypothetical protein